MWISQTRAIATLKEQTGLNGQTCERAIQKMPKKKDGKRLKVHQASLQELVDWANQVKRDAVAADTMKPLSMRTKQRIRAIR